MKTLAQFRADYPGFGRVVSHPNAALVDIEVVCAGASQADALAAQLKAEGYRVAPRHYSDREVYVEVKP